jgi:predicted nucleotidyltransferase component of viral defense system
MMQGVVLKFILQTAKHYQINKIMEYTTLTDNKDLFLELVSECAESMRSMGFRIDENAIEKDFHVYLMLKSIAKSDYSNSSIFKGGTALSRVLKITERFSEDVDICVNPKAKDSFSKLKIEKDFISKSAEKDYPRIEDHKEELKGGTRRKTIHSFPKIVTSSIPQYINENIILEVTAVRPSSKIECSKEFINSYIGEYLIESSQTKLIEKYDLKPFEFSVILPEYTLSDKLCRMVKEANKPNNVYQIGLKIRDLYDIHKLLQNKRVRDVFYSDKFIEIFCDAKIEEAENGNTILPFSETQLFTNPNEILKHQKENYEKFKSMILVNPPTLSDIAKTLSENFKRFRELDCYKIVPKQKVPVQKLEEPSQTKQTGASQKKTPVKKRVIPKKKRSVGL